jgi:hypothetical protein
MGHVEYMGNMANKYKILMEKAERRGHLSGLDVGGRVLWD